MSKKQDRTVYKTPDDKWADKRNSASRPAELYDTQKEALAAAKARLIKAGGGELITKGVDGKIRSKDTIAPGNDPNPPKDREH